MDRCALEFIARRWWRRAEIWIIALVLIAGGAVLGWQSAYWDMTSAQANQVKQIRDAYDAAMAERDKRLSELTLKAESAATKASKAATTANQAADKADEALSRTQSEAWP
jgi:predicted negative regulator of RcsB-dependent stress response